MQITRGPLTAIPRAARIAGPSARSTLVVRHIAATSFYRGWPIPASLSRPTLVALTAGCAAVCPPTRSLGAGSGRSIPHVVMVRRTARLFSAFFALPKPQSDNEQNDPYGRGGKQQAGGVDYIRNTTNHTSSNRYREQDDMPPDKAWL